MKKARTTTGKYVVEAVDKALAVLDCFNGPLGITLIEISQRVGLNKSRTFRLLHTLCERGYVERVDDGLRYRLGMKLFERAANIQHDLRTLTRGHMLTLHERFNETVNLGVISEGQVMYLDIVETSRPFRMSASIGSRMPIHRTSMGKAMLAYADLSKPTPLARCVDELPESACKGLKRELTAVLKRGYAVDDEENEPGVGCIGLPIFDAHGNPIASLSVSGPAHRTLANAATIARAVRQACAAISQKLGYTGDNYKAMAKDTTA